MPLAKSLQVSSQTSVWGSASHLSWPHNFWHVSCAVLCCSHDRIASPLSTDQALYCLSPFAMSVTMARRNLSPQATI